MRTCGECSISQSQRGHLNMTADNPEIGDRVCFGGESGTVMDTFYVFGCDEMLLGINYDKRDGYDKFRDSVLAKCVRKLDAS